MYFILSIEGNDRCPGMYHCPDSFCLPFHKVCDGKSDCPDGADEINCKSYTCPGKVCTSIAKKYRLV